MLLRTIPLIAVSMLVALLVACGDDDSGSPTGTATRIDTGGATSTATQPASTEDEKTPPPSGDGEESATPAVTAPGEVPTPPPTASVGTPAVTPADVAAFLESFEGQDVDQRECQYNQTTAVTDCEDLGLYAINPPIVGQDITCSIWVVENTPRAIACGSTDPPGVRYYEIQ